MKALLVLMPNKPQALDPVQLGFPGVLMLTHIFLARMSSEDPD